MNKKSFTQRAATSLYTTVMLQLVLTIMTLPFMLWWELPLTPLSIIGNIIHPLFLIPFLSASTLLFCAFLFQLPTWLLEKTLIIIHNAWMFFFRHCTIYWWISPLSFMGISICLLSVIGWHAVTKKQRIFFFTIMISIICALFIWHIVTPKREVLLLKKGTQTLRIYRSEKNNLIIKDYGYITRTVNIDALVDYEIAPHLLSHFGQPSHITLYSRSIGLRIQHACRALQEWGFSTTPKIASHVVERTGTSS